MRRIDQLLANLGYCSRREVRAWLHEGRVTVAGREADDPAQKANPADVRVDGEPLDHPDGLLLLLNKPLGRVCSHDHREGPSVFDLLPARWQNRHPAVVSVGRLDKETTGCLVLTDQTALVHRLTSPRHKVEKTYRATLDADLPPGIASLFADGQLVLPGETEPCAPARLSVIGPREADLVLTEGRFHQVRRMFSSQGCEVMTLHRSQFGPLNATGVAPGTWRELPPDFFDRPEGPREMNPRV